MLKEDPSVAAAKFIQAAAEQILKNVNQVIIGKDDIVRFAIISVFSQGHILIEDKPGVGKTMLTRALAKSISCSYKRIQFTPDLLPADVTGVTIFNQKIGNFEYRPGPLFTQFLLADEINRATPKTQSALLEAMEERQVTVDGATYQLPKPYIVMATQNPIEYEGTFPLPEAQLDRFMMNIQLGYPDSANEILVLEQQQFQQPIESLNAVISAQDLENAQAGVKNILIKREIAQYIVDIVSATRSHPKAYLGASPRGSLALYRTSQALAAIRGRNYVIPDDIKTLARPILAHRIIPKNDSANDPAEIIETILTDAIYTAHAPDSPAARR